MFCLNTHGVADPHPRDCVATVKLSDEVTLVVEDSDDFYNAYYYIDDQVVATDYRVLELDEFLERHENLSEETLNRMLKR